MQLAIKILYFLLFIAAYGAWAYVNHRLIENLKRPELATSRTKLLLLQELYAIVNYGGILIFVYLLSGFWSWILLIAFFGISQIGIVVTAVLWAILGSAEEKWHPRSIWAGSEFGLKHRYLFFTILILSVLVLIGYPVVAGIAYFRQSASPELTLAIFQYTLTTVALSGVVMLPFSIGIGASANIDEATRTRFLTNQFGSLIPNAFFIMLAFLAFGRNVFDLNNVVSPNLLLQVLAVVIVFFAVTAIFPYLWGTHFARAKRKMLYVREKRWLSELGDVLNVPSSALYATELQHAETEIEQSLAKFKSEDVMIELAEEIDATKGIEDDETLPGLKILADAYHQTREIDPRFRYLDEMRQLLLDIATIKAGLDARAADDEKIKFAHAWARIFERREERLAERRENEEGSSFLPQLAWSGLGILLSAVLSGVGKVLWERMAVSVFQP